MSGSLNPAASHPITMHDNMTISRKIHHQLVQKKNRWKLSGLELAVLKLHFQKNQYPTKDEKDAILNILQEKFDSKVNINQLSRWFQHEREKITKHLNKASKKNTYKKFSKQELDYLQECFDKNNYPSVEEMTSISKHLSVGLSKIENWYKHNRRSLAKKGRFTLKTKKYFKRDELSYLLDMFENYPRPSKEQILQMAERLGCNESQIKNWYANKRKKLKMLAKKSSKESPEDMKDTPSLAKNKFASGIHSGFLQSTNAGSTTSSSCPSTFGGSQSMDFRTSTSPSSVGDQQQQQQPFCGLPNKSLNENCFKIGLPILFVPTIVNSSSSMVVNTNIINSNNNNRMKLEQNIPHKKSSQDLNSLHELNNLSDLFKNPMSQGSLFELPSAFSAPAKTELPKSFGESLKNSWSANQNRMSNSTGPIVSMPINKAPPIMSSLSAAGAGTHPLNPIAPLVPISAQLSAISLDNPQVPYLGGLYLANNSFNNYCPIVFPPYTTEMWPPQNSVQTGLTNANTLKPDFNSKLASFFQLPQLSQLRSIS